MFVSVWLFPMQSSTECVRFCVVISHAEFHRVRAFLCRQSLTECVHFCVGRVPQSACISVSAEFDRVRAFFVWAECHRVRTFSFKCCLIGLKNGGESWRSWLHRCVRSSATAIKEQVGCVSAKTLANPSHSFVHCLGASGR